jgi:DNA-binding NtrC family response regulator
LTKKVPRILVVDDDVNICATLNLILKKRGWNVEIANTGKEAIDKSREHLFNVALLDIKLPDIEGTQLLKMLHETKPKMMKIIVTGHPEVKNAVEALNKGADAYLIKPLCPQDLLRIIKEKLNEQEQAEEMTEDKIASFLETRSKKLLEGLT